MASVELGKQTIGIGGNKPICCPSRSDLYTARILTSRANQANDTHALPQAISLLGLLSENDAFTFNKLLYFYVNAFACMTEIHVNATTVSNCLKKGSLRSILSSS